MINEKVKLLVSESAELHNAFEVVRVYYVKNTDRTILIYKLRNNKEHFKTCKGRLSFDTTNFNLYCWVIGKLMIEANGDMKLRCEKCNTEMVRDEEKDKPIEWEDGHTEGILEAWKCLKCGYIYYEPMD